MAKRRMTLTETLRLKIRESGWSIREVGRRSGLAPEVVCRFVNGRAGMGLGSLDALVDALELELVERPKKRPVITRRED